MAILGPEQAQEQLVTLLKEFHEENQEERLSPEREQNYFNRIQKIIQNCNLPSQLSFDVKINMNNGESLSAQDILIQNDYKIILSELKKLQEKYRFQFETKPSTLKQKGEELVLGNRVYALSQQLQGRGQKGLANFYKSGDEEFLIKEDEPATCLMEGTASFVKDAELIPLSFQSAINFASVATVTAENGKQFVASVQDRVKGEGDSKVKPWDVKVYGSKREPKTIWSYESWYPSAIKQNITELSPEAKWQLASGIFASAIVGDESLHVGQFMAVVDKDNNVTGITRIDLGARERFAVARGNKNQLDPYHASSFYQKSGQFYKDYVSFLLAEPGLNSIYTQLWVSLTSFNNNELEEKVFISSKESIIRQFNHIPPNLKSKALIELLDVINRSASNENKVPLPQAPIEQQIDFVASTIANMDANRVITMVSKGLEVYQAQLLELKKAIQSGMEPENREILLRALALQDSFLTSKPENMDLVNEAMQQLSTIEIQLTKLVKQSQSKPQDTELYGKIQLMSEVAAGLSNSIYLKLNRVTNADQHKQALKDLSSGLVKYQALQSICEYCRKTTSVEKRRYGPALMDKAMTGELAMVKYLDNTVLVKDFKAHASKFSYAARRATRGEDLLRQLCKLYHVDDKVLAMTSEARYLLDTIKHPDYANAAKLIEAYQIEDALVPDQQGKTALHYLMENASINEMESVDAIINVLSKSIGIINNTPLDIKDADGNTPLDLLLENPSAKEVIKAINDRKIIAYGVVCQLQDFFKLGEYNQGVRTKVEALSPRQAEKGWRF